MLDFRNTLDLPNLQLIYDKTTSYKDDEHGASCSSYDRGLYVLDWENFDNRKKEKLNKRSKKYYPELEIPFVSTLPEPFDSIVKNFKFSLTTEYMKEIQLHTEKAIMEWNHPRDLDTFVRETCLIPAKSHLWTAFYLLSDCIWDCERGCWWRNEMKYIAHYMMAYKFWCHQTGEGCLENNAMIYRLRQNLEDLRHSVNQEHHIISIAVKESFLNAISEHKKELEFARSLPLREGILGTIAKKGMPSEQQKEAWLRDKINEWNDLVRIGVLSKNRWISSQKNQRIFPTHIGYDEVSVATCHEEG